MVYIAPRSLEESGHVHPVYLFNGQLWPYPHLLALILIVIIIFCFLCFDTVGWATESARGLSKPALQSSCICFFDTSYDL